MIHTLALILAADGRNSRQATDKLKDRVYADVQLPPSSQCLTSSISFAIDPIRGYRSRLSSRVFSTCLTSEKRRDAAERIVSALDSDDWNERLWCGACSASVPSVRLQGAVDRCVTVVPRRCRRGQPALLIASPSGSCSTLFPIR